MSFFGHEFRLKRAFFLLLFKLVVLPSFVGFLNLLVPQLIQSFSCDLLVSCISMLFSHDLWLECTIFQLSLRLLPGCFFDPVRRVDWRLLVFALSVLFSKLNRRLRQRNNSDFGLVLSIKYFLELLRFNHFAHELEMVCVQRLKYFFDCFHVFLIHHKDSVLELSVDFIRSLWWGLHKAKVFAVVQSQHS